MTDHPLPPSWREMIANIHGWTTFGQPGVRDPENPCAEFEPVEGIDMLGCQLTAPGDGCCQSDGHYLCLGCGHLDLEGSRFADDFANEERAR